MNDPKCCTYFHLLHPKLHKSSQIVLRSNILGLSSLFTAVNKQGHFGCEVLSRLSSFHVFNFSNLNNMALTTVTATLLQKGFDPIVSDLRAAYFSSGSLWLKSYDFHVLRISSNANVYPVGMMTSNFFQPGFLFRQ